MSLLDTRRVTDDVALDPDSSTLAEYPSGRRIDTVAARQAVRDLLRALGEDPDDTRLAETPHRVVESYRELLEPERFEATTFENDSAYDDLVLVRDIPFRSLCEHHLLPFTGVAHVGYVPGGRIVGLSKLARAVEHLACDLQVQERLTSEIVEWIEETLAPVGAGVVVVAEHACMSMRGVRAVGATTVTSALRGSLRDDDRARREFLSRTGG